MTFLEALEEAKKGKKVRHNLWCSEIYLAIENGNIKICNTPATCLIKDNYTSNSWEIYKEKILTDEEKEYLNNVIKPFKNKVISIVKKKSRLLSNKSLSFIQINIKCFNDVSIWYETISLPTFVKGSMYKNMKADYEYTVEDLDL